MSNASHNRQESTELFRFSSARQQLPQAANTNDDHYQLAAINHLNQALYGDIAGQPWPDEVKKALAEIRRQFAHKLAVFPYPQLVSEGYISQLLDDYLGLLLIAGEQETAQRSLTEAREYYYAHPQTVQDLAYRLQHLMARAG